METIQAIKTRRSIRKFADKSVSEESVRIILQAAMAAPSAGNEKPWHFVVVRDREMLEEITKIHRYAQMAKEAQVAIVVCGDENLQKFRGFWVQDCSAATQNILLAAHDQGLGAVWCGIHPSRSRVRAFRKLLGLPNHVTPLSVVPIGYPGEERPPNEGYDSARVHKEVWH